MLNSKSDSKKSIRRMFSGLLLKAAKTLDEPHLNSSLCLIFNGMASMVAIVFIILFIIDKREPLLLLGFLGCVAMTLANIVDLFPFWLNGLAKVINKKEQSSM